MRPELIDEAYARRNCMAKKALTEAGLEGMIVSTEGQNEIDLDWSNLVGRDASEELCVGNLITDDQMARAALIIAQVIHLRLVASDRPDFGNRRYASKGTK